MQNATPDELQAGIKIAGRNINNLRYIDDTTLMAESEEEQKSLLKRVKEESEKAGLKLNIQKTKILASVPSFMANRWEKLETVAYFIFLGPQIGADNDCSQKIRHLLLGRKAITKVHIVKAMIFPLQYSCLENPMDGGNWQATVHGVAKSRTQLRDHKIKRKSI